MADDFDLADFGESFNPVAHLFGPQHRAGIGRRNIQRRQFQAALARRRLLEDQIFVLIGVARRFLDLVGQMTLDSSAAKAAVKL